MGGSSITSIPFSVTNRYYSGSQWYSVTSQRTLFYYEEALSILGVIFSGISLLLTPLLFILRKKKVFKFIYMFFLFAAAGVSLANGICNLDYSHSAAPIVLIVLAGIELAIGFVYFISVLKVRFEPKLSKPSNKLLKKLDALKKEGLLTEEEYEAKKALLPKQTKVDDPYVCPECGERRHQKDKFCASCGYKFPEEVAVVRVKPTLSPLSKVAQIFFYIGFGLTCATVIGVCWALPMLHIYRRDRDTIGKHSIGFKVCTIIFISKIAGILMLVDYQH